MWDARWRVGGVKMRHCRMSKDLAGVKRLGSGEP
jgi:hypothetical protein